MNIKVSKEIKFSKKYVFTYPNIFSFPECPGVYILSSKSFDIYVGLAELQIIRKRVLRHFDPKSTQNPRLRNFIKSRGTTTFIQYFCCEKKYIRELERYCIVTLQPRANHGPDKEKSIEKNYFKGYKIIS